MRCCVVSDVRLERRGGAHYDPRQSFPEGHWTELLRTFDRVELYARVEPCEGAEFPGHLVLPPEIEVIEAPYYVGFRRLIGALWRVWRSVWRLTADGDRIFILRGPGVLAHLIWFALRLRRGSYAVEVLGDVSEAMRFSSARLGKAFAAFALVSTRIICRGAAAGLYISQALASRYPTSPRALSAVISDVRLPAAIWHAPAGERPSRPFTMITVANMEQPYKGHDSLLRCLARLRRDGRDVRLWLVGDGRQREAIERYATELGVRELVELHGTIPWGPQLFELLDRATLFVLPSLTEGLGKALLEAMARGLPGVGSDVGGIPELLPSHARFRAGDDAAMAAVIARLIDNPAALRDLANACYQRACEYDDAVLAPRRTAYYEAVRARLGA